MTDKDATPDVTVDADTADTDVTDVEPNDGPNDEAPEPTYGNQAPASPAVAPEAPPPAGVKFAEDGRALISVDEYRAAIEREYSRWVATEDILIDGIPAFRRGDPVPRSHVERGVVSKDSIVGRDTKTADALFDELA